MRRIIKLDISRTFQNKDMFKEMKIKEIMLNILFVWSKEHSDLSYRQGMNENLAILIINFVPFYFQTCSVVEESDFNFEKEESLAKMYDFLHDDKFLEADLFTAFSKLMELGLKKQYVPQQKNELTNAKLRSDRIYEEILKVSDLQLYQYFNSINFDIFPITQRWIKCVFSREFHPTDTSVLWDAIFAELEGELEFIDFLSCAMLEYVRSDCCTLNSDEQRRKWLSPKAF